MNTIRMALVAAMVTTWCMVAGAVRAAEADPRPVVLVIGEQNSLPTGNGASWAQILQKSKPDWRIVVDAATNRRTSEVARGLDALLKAQPHVEAVLVFMGTGDVQAAAYAECNAAKLGQEMGGILKAIKAAPAAAKAKVFLVTPMPVVDSRLDQWSGEKFKDGEKNMAAIAEAFRGAAKEQGVDVIDFYNWAYADKADGKPARLVGSIGWTVRDWGHPIMARFFEEQLGKLVLSPPDAEAFLMFTRERDASAKIDEILAATSEGTVAHGQAYPSKLVAAKPAYYEIDLPADAIGGEELNVLFMSHDKAYAAIGNSNNRPFAQTTLVMTADGKEVKVPLTGRDWQVLDESRPQAAVEANRYRFNMQKMNHFGLTSNEEGKRRWVVARFDLKPLAGKKPTTAKFVIGAAGGMEVFTPPDKTDPLAVDKIGGPSVAIITGSDVRWDDAAATWKTRDGKIGWTGGNVDAVKRKAALDAFLKDSPAPLAEKRARQMLKELP